MTDCIAASITATDNFVPTGYTLVLRVILGRNSVWHVQSFDWSMGFFAWRVSSVIQCDNKQFRSRWHSLVPVPQGFGDKHCHCSSRLTPPTPGCAGRMCTLSNTPQPPTISGGVPRALAALPRNHCAICAAPTDVGLGRTTDATGWMLSPTLPCDGRLNTSPPPSLLFGSRRHYGVGAVDDTRGRGGRRNGCVPSGRLHHHNRSRRVGSPASCFGCVSTVYHVNLLTLHIRCRYTVMLVVRHAGGACSGRCSRSIGNNWVYHLERWSPLPTIFTRPAGFTSTNSDCFACTI